MVVEKTSVARVGTAEFRTFEVSELQGSLRLTFQGATDSTGTPAFRFVDAPDGSVTLACAPETEAQTFEATGKPTITQMHDVPVPTLVAYGTHDPFPGPGDFAPLVAAALPNGTERAYPHLGHFGPLQDPDTIADDALEFLTAHP